MVGFCELGDEPLSSTISRKTLHHGWLVIQLISEISCSHGGGEYEDDCLLGCCAV
jgi:hypothetical protein